MSSRGKFILMADADGATKFSDIEKVEAGLNDLKPKPVWQCSLFILLSYMHVLMKVSYCESIPKNVYVYLGQYGNFLWFQSSS